MTHGIYAPFAQQSRQPAPPPKPSALAVLFKKVLAWLRRHWFGRSE